MTDVPDQFNYISFANALDISTDRSFIEMNRGRMFEYTPTELEKRLEGLTEPSLRFLRSLPTFLCSEAYSLDGGGIGMVVRFGRLTRIQLTGGLVRASFRPIYEFGELEFESLEDARSVFDAEKFQLYRTHWAVRDGSARAVLERLQARTPELSKELDDPDLAYRQRDLPRRRKFSLGTAKTVASFLKYLTEVPDQGGNETFFRGHKDESFELTPSLLRKNGKGNSRFLPNEARLCKELLIAHYDDFQGDQSTFDRLVRMQHFGLPNRLLDITTNPLMALYFACADSEETPEIAGEVVMFSIANSKVKYFDSDTVRAISNISQLTYEQKNEIDLSLDMEDFNELESIKKLLHHIRSEKGYFESRIEPRDIGSIQAVKAKQTNNRIRSQSGAFLLFGHEATLPDAGTDDINVDRITIRNKKVILEQLNKLNVNAMTAYPSIDETAAHLMAQCP